MDNDDACPSVPGVATEDPGTNGCPADRDGDTIADNDDACPDVAGQKSDDPKVNGCPPATDLDRDKDGVANNVDACPDTPGVASPDPAKNGCPRVVVSNKQIKILEQIQFETGSAKLLPESDPILTEVQKILKSRPDIRMVRVEGHTDNRGGNGMNQRLSESRAKAVADWLQAHGVDESRLSSAGFGQSRPLETNDTEEGRQTNRRVEFHIEDAAGAAASQAQ